MNKCCVRMNECRWGIAYVTPRIGNEVELVVVYRFSSNSSLKLQVRVTVTDDKNIPDVCDDELGRNKQNFLDGYRDFMANPGFNLELVHIACYFSISRSFSSDINI